MKKTTRLGAVFEKGGAFSPAEITREINARILRTQHRVGRLYNNYFTLNVSLVFATLVGACFAFVGDDCHGKITFSSPMVYCLFLIAVFFFFQTFILVPLNVARATRMLCVAVCGHYLAYQSYGFWSLENVDAPNICKPYTYANIAYGYIWMFIPALLLIFASFFAGDKKEDFNYEQDCEEQTSE